MPIEQEFDVEVTFKGHIKVKVSVDDNQTIHIEDTVQHALDTVAATLQSTQLLDWQVTRVTPCQ